MKKIILLFAVSLFCVQFSYAQFDNLDPSFGDNGIVRTDLGKNYNYSSFGEQVLEQTDGTIYLIVRTSFDQYFITKRNPNGSIDSSYGHNGSSVIVRMEEASGVLQPDGKIVMGGFVNSSYMGFDISLARFNSEGSLDSSFSDDGKVLTTNFSFVGSDPKVSVLQNNGKIIVCAGAKIARYNSNGSPDTTFSEDGFQDNNFAIIGGAVQSDGKIVLTASSALFRYNLDGTPDATFSEDGMQTTDFDYPPYDPGYSNPVAIQNDGKIVVVGYSGKYESSIIARYNTDGSPDESFSGDGIALIIAFDNNNPVYSLALHSNGKIVVAANTGSEDNRNFTIAQYDNDGSPDKTFSEDGIQKNDFEIASIATQEDGRIIAGGSVNSNFALARYNLNGTPDNTFDEDGKLIDNSHSGNTTYKSSAIQKDGKIVVAGETWNGVDFDFIIVRYNTDGTLDNTFSGDGIQNNIGFASTSLAIQNLP